MIGHKIIHTFILKKVTLVSRSTDDFKSTSFSVLDDGKFV